VIEHEFYRPQFQFVAAPERFTAFVGGIGSGKTYAGCCKALSRCEEPGLGLVVAPTYPMLRDATLRTFMEVCDGAMTDFRRGEMKARVARGEVLFRSADDPERLRGPNLSWAYIDEAALCHKMTWPIVIGRLREAGTAGPCWITTTPKGRNWVWTEFVEKRREGYAMFKASTADNPYLAPEFVEDLKTSYVGDFARQELHGEFVAFEGLIYEEFDREVHVRRPPEQFVRVVGGVDWGYTNPAVILVVGLDGDGRAWVVDEFYQRRVLIGDVVAAAAEMRDRWHVGEFYCDPSEPANIQQMARAGVPVYGANNAVGEGIQKVKARLPDAGDGQRRLYVSPGCANTVAEFESYCWKQQRDGELKDEPDKANDHAMDALRYALMALDKRRLYIG